MSYDKKPAPTHAAVIDWETLSTRSKAVLPSVGVVFGDLDTGEIIDTLHITMDVQSQIDAGYHVSADTLAFWIMQDQHARTYLNRILSGKFKHGSRQDGFRQLFNFLSNLPRNTRIFGNGPTFDLAICIEEWKNAGLPWEFWNERCVRSWIDLCDLAIGGKVKDKLPFEGVKHHPVDDAKHEFNQMHAVLSWMRAMARPTVTINASELPVDSAYDQLAKDLKDVTFRSVLNDLPLGIRRPQQASPSGLILTSDKIPGFKLTSNKVFGANLSDYDTRSTISPATFAVPYGQERTMPAVDADLDPDRTQRALASAASLAAAVATDGTHASKQFSTGGVVGLGDNTAELDTELEIPVAVSNPLAVEKAPYHPISLQLVIDSCQQGAPAFKIESDNGDCELYEVYQVKNVARGPNLFLVEAVSVLAVRTILQDKFEGPSGLWNELAIHNCKTDEVFEFCAVRPRKTTQQADHRHSLQSVIDACIEQGEVVSIDQPEDSDRNLFDVIYTTPKGSELTVFIVEAHTVDDVKKRLESEYYGPCGLWFRLHVRSAQTSDVFEPWPADSDDLAPEIE